MQLRPMPALWLALLCSALTLPIVPARASALHALNAASTDRSIAGNESPEPTEEPTAAPTSSSGPAIFYQHGSSHSESSSESSGFEIGTPSPSPSPSATPSPTPTPNPWRALTVASKSLSASSEGSIEVLASFAAARRDGTSAAACVSFKNTATRTATRVLFGFNLIDGDGRRVGAFVLDRQGTFSPGIDIRGYEGLADWASGAGNRGYADNCTSIRQNVAALPILTARYVTYAIERVEYADGTSWNAASPQVP